jgi:hypothetical protein
MPRFRSARNRVRPRFHCFHTTDRSRRRSHELSLPRLSHGALRLIHLELEPVRDEACNALHHSRSRSFADHVNVAAVGITHEVVTAPLARDGLSPIRMGGFCAAGNARSSADIAAVSCLKSPAAFTPLEASKVSAELRARITAHFDQQPCGRLLHHFPHGHDPIGQRCAHSRGPAAVVINARVTATVPVHGWNSRSAGGRKEAPTGIIQPGYQY